MVKPHSQNARVLRALADGRWHSTAEIHRKAGTMRLNSRMSELRNRHGYVIHRTRIPDQPSEPLAHRYRLDAPLSKEELDRLFPGSPMPPSPVPVLDRKEVPRDLEHRFRIYRMVYDELELVGTAEHEWDFGEALLNLGRRGAFAESCVGVLDTYGSEEEKGTWVINPWDTAPLTQ